MEHLGARDIFMYARGFASCAHRTQKRKYTNEPYIVHLLEVSNILIEHNCSANTIIAGILHDILEDTPITEAELREQFHGNIVDIVLQVTDISKPEDGNRQVRKELDLAHASKCDDNGANVKFADLISNTRSIIQYDKQFAKIYLPEKRKILLALSDKGNDELFDRATETLEAAEKELAALH